MNSTIDSRLRQKTISYIILGILIVIILAAYIYITISSKEASPTTAPTATNLEWPIVTLTPEQSAAKAAAIAQVENQQPVPLTAAQSSAKAAAIAKMQAQK
jgi:hypothetical protein